MSDISEHITSLYPIMPNGLRTYIWTLPDRRSYWADTTEGLENHAQAAEDAGKDVYIGIALTDKRGGARSRIKDDEAVALPGVWFEIDIKDGDAHKKSNLPTEDEAFTFLRDDVISTFGEPSLVIHSGHGLHVYYLFEQPTVIDSSVRHLLHDIGAQVNAMLAEHEWQGDSVHDASRVLRVAGTTNRKGSPVLAAIANSTGLRFTFETLRGRVRAQNRADAVGQRPEGSSDSSEPTLSEGDIPELSAALYRELMADSEFRRTWQRKRGPGRPSALKDDSDSGYAFALINKCINEGLDDLTIVAVIREWIREQDIPPKGKDLRWITWNIAKARRTTTTQADIQERMEAAENAATATTPDEVWSALSEYAGVPVVGIRRYGNDVSDGRYLDTKAHYSLLVQVSGQQSEIDIGTIDKMIAPNVFRASIIDATSGQSTPPALKRDKWEPIIFNAIRYRENVDVGKESQMLEWVRNAIESYLAKSPPESTLETAISYGKAFVNEFGRILIHVPSLEAHIQFNMSSKVSSHKLGRWLRELGATRDTPRVGGKQIRLWVLPEEFHE